MRPRSIPATTGCRCCEVPAASNFPGTGAKAAGGNGFAPGILSQDDWMHRFKKDCNFCHQLGNQITRTLTHMDFAKLGFKSHEDAWLYRTSLGVRGTSMQAAFLQFGGEGQAKTMADWTRAVESGAVPPMPPRPQGIERNVVVTLWDIGGPQDFMHDEIATDKNNPTVNAYGPIYAVSAGHGTINVVDPVTNDAWKVVIPTRDDPRKVATRFPPPARPSNFWGMEQLWGQEHPADPHNPMMDSRGRVWATSKIRNDEPAFCKEGSQNKYAQYYPLRFSCAPGFGLRPGHRQVRAHRHLLRHPSPAVRQRCRPHAVFQRADRPHVRLAQHAPCSTQPTTNKLRRAGARRSSTPMAMARSPSPGTRPTTRIRIRSWIPKCASRMYTVIPDPNDANIVWGASEGANGEERGYIVRLNRGANPPQSCVAELYRVPKGTLNPRGMDVDSHGIAVGGHGCHLAVGPL